MPQASDEQRAEWGIDDGPVIRFLEEHGYVLTPQWEWVIPAGHTPTEKEVSAVQFLIDEWDFGGWAKTVAVRFSDGPDRNLVPVGWQQHGDLRPATPLFDLPGYDVVEIVSGPSGRGLMALRAR